MAPITDEMVQSLQDTIAKLESRVHQLESRLGGGDGGSSKAPSDGQSARMILMGPPGAGEWLTISPCETSANHLDRQGHPGTEDPREILCLPSGKVYMRRWRETPTDV